MTSTTTESGAFHGAKLALLVDGQVLTLMRDARPDIAFPGHWDLPGGGREGRESPVACVLRETREETGLRLTPEDLHWGRMSQGAKGSMPSWFYVRHDDRFDAAMVHFGNEGRGWRLMSVGAFIAHQRVVPHLGRRLASYLEMRR